MQYFVAMILLTVGNCNPSDTECNFLCSVVSKNYQHILSLAFAIKEINENPHLLPNITLGLHVYDSYFNAMWTYHVTMLLTSKLEEVVPNYLCGMKNNLMAVIGGLDSEISLNMAIILEVYKIPQV